ncbi:MAG: NAD(P)(+) transhydrogenase (Re/Si-specific) subunit beta [Deltaproteobacteria bacterium]|nr:NAD(P)(+) transhydrogenase (Re/Si-specific) subunit beta [Deltaproteobacteria bacterium]
MTGVASSNLVLTLYLVSAVLFIVGLKGLTRIRTARRGNIISSLAMLIAIVATLIDLGTFSPTWIIAGVVIGGAIGAIVAVRVQMTAIPEMVALFNGCGGGASALVALSVIWFALFEKQQDAGVALLSKADAVTTMLSVFIGALTLTGSVVAFLKLRGWISGQPILIPGRHVLNGLLILGSLGITAYFVMNATDPSQMSLLTLVVCGLSLVLGIFLVIPIGGADMPVVISLLNSYSGLAACATGFVLSNNVLIISGALVGASGLILTQIMCKAMNRSLANVLFGGFGAEETTPGGGADARDYGPVRSYSAEEAAMVLESASSVIVVPGYGLAVAQAQHAVRELGDLLEKQDVDVKYAIHPVAGRMPGHMNVLLAESDVPYEQLHEMDQINPEFRNTDVVLVVGANDVVNPAASKDSASPIYGMPILEVHNASSVIVIKRSLSPGFAGIKNELFEYDNTMMLFDDAKKALQGLVAELKEAAG